MCFLLPNAQAELQSCLPFTEPREGQGELCRNSSGRGAPHWSLSKTSSWNTVPFTTRVSWDTQNTGYCPHILYYHFALIEKQHSNTVDMQAPTPQNEQSQTIWTTRRDSLFLASQIHTCASHLNFKAKEAFLGWIHLILMQLCKIIQVNDTKEPPFSLFPDCKVKNERLRVVRSILCRLRAFGKKLALLVERTLGGRKKARRSVV